MKPGITDHEVEVLIYLYAFTKSFENYLISPSEWESRIPRYVRRIGYDLYMHDVSLKKMAYGHCEAVGYLVAALSSNVPILLWSEKFKYDTESAKTEILRVQGMLREKKPSPQTKGIRTGARPPGTGKHTRGKL